MASSYQIEDCSLEPLFAAALDGKGAGNGSEDGDDELDDLLNC